MSSEEKKITKRRANDELKLRKYKTSLNSCALFLALPFTISDMLTQEGPLLLGMPCKIGRRVTHSVLITLR